MSGGEVDGGGGGGQGPVALANTIRWRLEEKKRLEKEEEEERRRAAEEERRRKERERTRTPGPFSPEVMVEEGPVLLEDSWCRSAPCLKVENYHGSMYMNTHLNSDSIPLEWHIFLQSPHP